MDKQLKTKEQQGKAVEKFNFDDWWEIGKDITKGLNKKQSLKIAFFAGQDSKELKWTNRQK